eukprot:gnl/MRDRNA2_/MRDRNA2_114264_c0_seq1.p1 gnl/MRDRNA2_/MRDRNA2_114264_c0~~gnl/MRDRNA2_/MRDRNA2_114264_c0_seq1.p1  ORF type:complete len:251 (-),score=70.14 gnl/MRDRNA2_/MRDRNA2_114264_c0_seq1:91-843(-)
MVALRVTCLASFFALASAAARVTQQPQLKGQAAVDLKFDTLRSKVVTALGGLALHTAPSVGAAAASKAAGAAAKAPGGTNQPVAVQVEEKVVEKLHKDLSPACSKRFSAMMKGEGPQMHQFNEHGESKGQCDQLEGKLCAQEVAITEAYTAPKDGRKLEQRLEVTGNSCLPKECMSQSDLNTLATFMHKQTKEVLPGQDLFIELNVDCSKSGGGTVLVGKPDAKPEQPQKSAAFVFGFGSTVAILCSLAF